MAYPYKRPAYCISVLLNQVNDLWPGRNRASDGILGDAAHAAVQSEHNPNSAGIVTAIDITHDPASGADMQKLADALVASGDDRIWYVIFNRRIWEGGWTAYSGTSDPHTNHLHLSVAQDAARYDNGNPWDIMGGNMNNEQATQLALYIRLLEGESVAEANSHSADDVKHILADPGYAAALAKQIYQGARWQNFAWKAGHYVATNAVVLKKGLYEVQ